MIRGHSLTKWLIVKIFSNHKHNGMKVVVFPLCSYIMPRVVADQRAKFQTDPLLKQLQVDSEIRYTGHCECSLEEKRLRFRTDCYEGSCRIGFVCNGINLILSRPKTAPGGRYSSSDYADFMRERGKVFITCPLIFNGVCVKFYGYLDVEELVGAGHLEFDENLAQAEDHLMRETLRLKTATTTSRT